MFSAVKLLIVSMVTLLFVLLFELIKATELPPVLGRAANSANHLLFRCMLRNVCLSFPWMFRNRFRF